MSQKKPLTSQNQLKGDLKRANTTKMNLKLDKNRPKMNKNSQNKPKKKKKT